VGVSVVNALSDRLDVEIRREGKVWDIGFARGEKVRELSEVGTTTKKTLALRSVLARGALF